MPELGQGADYTRNFPLAWEEFNTDAGDAFGAAVGQAFTFPGSAVSLIEEARVLEENGFSQYFLKGEVEPGSLSKTLSADEANLRGKAYGLQFNEPVREDVLEIRLNRKKKVLERESIINRAPASLGTGGAVLSGTLLGAIADPVNIAASFVPVVGEARAAQLARVVGGGAGRLRLAKGFIEGAVGNALIEPLAIGVADLQQLDYDMYDSLTNIALGGVIGSGLHFSGGYIGDRLGGRVRENALPDRIESASPLTRERTLRSSVADMMEGRPVNVEPILKSDPKYEIDPFDPRTWDEVRAEPKARFFDPGEPTGARFNNYTRPTPQELKYMEWAVSEVEKSTPGQKIFIERDFQGSTPDIIGFKGNSPEWFRRYNKDVKKLKQGSTLTKDRARKVLEKMARNESLGKDEVGVAQALYNAGQDIRRANVSQMIESRIQRQEARGAELDSIARRESLSNIKGISREFAADKNGPSQLTREMDAKPIKPEDGPADLKSAEEAVSEAEELVNELEAVMTDSDRSLIKQFDDEIKEANEMAKAIKVFASCMMRG